MEMLWLVVLGTLTVGYFALAGFDYGSGLLLPFRKKDVVLQRMTPFFLGNEVWLVAAVGLLLGAFPWAEGQLLAAYRTPFTIALFGVVLTTASYGLRIFSPSGHWDTLARVGGVAAAVGWGAAIGAIVQGGRFHVTLLVVACAVALLALLAAHGWAFLRRRWPILAVTSLALAGAVTWAGAHVDLVAASDSALSLLAPVAWVVIPLLVLLQGATWWIFRGLPPAESSSRRAVSR